jgi:prepilin-type N-terminal cleavage/methylation domain-containing protein
MYEDTQMNFNKNAFTLIELLVVVLIIGIIAAIALPQYLKIVNKIRWTEAAQNVRFLQQSAKRYELTYSVYPQSIDSLDISFTGETTDIPSSISGISTGSSPNIHVGRFIYGILNSEDAWNHAPAKVIFAYDTAGKHCKLFFGKISYLIENKLVCLCEVGSPAGEIARKVCGQTLNGVLYSNNFGGHTVYVID